MYNIFQIMFEIITVVEIDSQKCILSIIFFLRACSNMKRDGMEQDNFYHAFMPIDFPNGTV